MTSQDSVERALTRVDELEKTVVTLTATAEKSSSTLASLDKQLHSVVGAAASLRPAEEVLAQRFEERERALDQVLKQYAEKTSADAKVHGAYTADLRAQVLEVAKHYGVLDKKVGVLMRFLDWFTDVKLKGAAFDRDYVTA